MDHALGLPAENQTQDNKTIFIAAALLFLVNQAIEFLVITFFDFNYAGLCAWDCAWYSEISSQGYDVKPSDNPRRHATTEWVVESANWVFFPAFPLVAKMIGLLSQLVPPWSFIITSKLFFALSIFAFVKFALSYYPQLNAFLLAAVVTLNPYAIYANVGYTESLFLLLTCVFFYYLKKDYVLTPGLISGLLASVRAVGISASLALAAKMIPRLRQSEGKVRLRILAALLLAPLGLSLFMLFLYHHVGDALAFSHMQQVWGRVPSNPIFVILEGLMRGDMLERLWVCLAIFGLGCSVFLALSKKIELALFLGCGILLPLSTELISMPRYVTWQAPVLLVLSLLLSYRKLWMIAFPLFTVCLAYMYFSWFSGKVFVI